MQRLLGALFIVLGCVILVWDVSSLDIVVLSVSSSHGIHLSDVIGAAFVAAGIAILWTAPNRREGRQQR
jgi:hypothetical protein